MNWILGLLVVFALLWAVTRFHRSGEDLSRFDAAVDTGPPHTGPSPEYHQAADRKNTGSLSCLSEACPAVQQRSTTCPSDP